MQAVLRSGGQAEGALGRWLAAASESLARCRDGHPVGRWATASGADAVDRLAMVNVAVQLDRLARHPRVAAALASGRVRLVGLFFDIPTARMSVLEGDRFAPASPDRIGSGSAPVVPIGS
jgi:carbonic anhydrase